MRNKILIGVISAAALLAAACTETPGGGGPALNNPPQAAISVNTDEGYAHFELEASGAGSTDTDGTVVGHSWDFGDGNTSTGPTADNLYIEDGTYLVTLTVTDDDGASSTAEQLITVFDNPDGRYVATDGTDTGTCTDSGAPCLTVQFATTVADATGDTVYVEAGNYPEMVYAPKDIEFKGANQGRSAGVDSIGRRPESAVKGIRSGTTPASQVGSVARAISIDGMKIDPQGDAALTSVQNQPMVRLFGSPAGNVIKNTVFTGGALVPGCGFACTTMADQAIWVQSGAITFEDNLFENLRRAAWIYQTGPAGALVTSGTVTGNVFKDITSFGMRIAPAGGNPAMVGITVDGNVFDSTNVGSASTPAGVNATTGGNTITNNSFTKVSSAVFLYICSASYVMGPQTITGNDFVDNNAGVNIFVETPASCPLGNIDGTIVQDNNFTGVRVSDGVTPSTGVSGTNLPAYFAGGRAPIDATCNWFDTATGPNTGGNIALVDPGLVVSPWLVAPAPDGACTGA